MRKVTSESCHSSPVYIPHHSVLREHSSTSHLRVVFNASHPTSNGKSLNDHLHIGPKLQTDLPSVIIRWRQFRYVYTAKMYCQILVDSRDIDYQRILWRPTPNEAIQSYQLLTVTYGTACALYLALRVLQQLASDDGSDFPLAVPILRQHIYVDDCVFGTDNMPLAHSSRLQLEALLRRAGFQLRKWASNSSELLSDIDPHDHGLAQSKPLNPDERITVLGIQWQPDTDAFHFNVKSSNSPPSTKRLILSTIARLFDPLGWLAPVVITAKILMQQLWLLKCKWDDPIPDRLLCKWRDYYSQLPMLKEVSIPRWTEFGSDTLAVEIHGFADASSHAYGASVYLRVIRVNGSVKVTLVIAKSKVAPLKPVSIPRFELCATVLLSRAIVFIKTILSLKRVSCHCWTDSSVALAWLRQHPSHWTVFVANRVNEVQTQLPDAIWHHVQSHQNPADLVSRDVMPASLKNHPLWWEGPDWLKLSADHWPVSPPDERVDSPPEERSGVQIHLAPSHNY